MNSRHLKISDTSVGADSDRRGPLRTRWRGAGLGLLSLALHACSYGSSAELVSETEFGTAGVRDDEGPGGSAANESDSRPTSTTHSSGSAASESELSGSESSASAGESGRAESSTGGPIDDDPSTMAFGACPDTPSCFSWCGVRKSDGECISADSAELSPAANLLCPELRLWVYDDGGGTSLGEETTQDDVRCFMQAIRYSNKGSLAMSWSSEDGLSSATLRVELRGDEAADLSMLVDRDADCGAAIALWAPMSHTRTREDSVYTDCLDTKGPVDLAGCLLGPAMSFHTDFDIAFDVPFPWLSGYCLPV